MKDQLNEILKNHFQVKEEDLQDAFEIRQKKGGRLEEILFQKKVISENQMLQAMGMAYNIPFWPELPFENICTDVTRFLPIQYLKKYILVPLLIRTPPSLNAHAHGAEPKTEGLKENYVIAIHGLDAFQPLDDLAKIMGMKEFTIVFSTRNAILSAINMSYDLCRDSAEQLVQDMETNGQTIISEIEDTADLLDDTSDAPIIKLVNHV
ncbi:MAG: type II secretion system protein GspE, partial [Thermodesulfobacteriota bacterium]